MRFIRRLDCASTVPWFGEIPRLVVASLLVGPDRADATVLRRALGARAECRAIRGRSLEAEPTTGRGTLQGGRSLAARRTLLGSRGALPRKSEAPERARHVVEPRDLSREPRQAGDRV